MKYTLEYVKSEYIKANIKFINTIFINSKYAHNLQCLICNHNWTSYFTRFLEGKRCPNCTKLKLINEQKHSTLYVIEQYKLKEIILLDSEYKNNHTKHNLKCIKCNYKWTAKYNNIIYNNTGCPECAKQRVINKRRLSTEFIKNQYIRNNIVFLDINFISSAYKHNVQCLSCNHIWTSRYGNFKQRGDGCPECSLSKNEKSTIQYIEKILNLKPEKKKIEMSCDFQNHCVVDAYLEIRDKKVIIEYNGHQHYEPTYFKGRQYKLYAEQRFEKQQKRDEWLRNYCKENNIILIEIDGRKYQNDKIYMFLNEELSKINFY